MPRLNAIKQISLIEDYKNGVKTAKICKKYGISRNYLYTILNDNKIKRDRHD